MNLSEIRAQARTIRNQTNGIFSLFAIPTLVTILSTYLSPNRHLERLFPVGDQSGLCFDFWPSNFSTNRRIYHRPALFIC